MPEHRLAAADALLAKIPDPVILVDAHAVLVEANAAAHRLLPLLQRGEPLSLALRAPDVLDAIAEVVSTGRPAKVEYAERRSAGRAFEVHVSPLHGRGTSGSDEVVLVFRDLTAARRLERMRVDFIANVSHELRTPLASLLGFVETLQGPARNDPAARDKFLEIMREQAQRMARLIDDLLSLSRIELQAHVQPETPVDVLPIVQHVIDSLSALAAERGVIIALEADSRPLIVRGDRDELLRVGENLIENAIKYGGSGGRVEVALRRAMREDGPGQIELSVRDYGPGIAPEHLPRLTERFYRVDVTESRQQGGTGLGLALVKHIVNHHRGRLRIESEPGQGATFTVALQEHVQHGATPLPVI